MSVYDTIRVEGSDPDNPFYVYFETMGATGQRQKLENFEIAHFRLIGDPNFLPYGKSVLEGGRRVFRQLILMEDAMLIHRIMRAPEKRAFYLDVGMIPPNEVDNHINQLIASTKKTPFIDPQTGEYNLKYNMMNILEDFYIPVRGSDSGTKIDTLGGLEYNGIEDIEYLKNRMMAAFKVPKAFIGYDETISGKTTLSAEDARFARTVERVQRIVESELTKIAIIHLYSQGFKDEELVDFNIKLTNPSIIYEQEKINLWKERIILARDMKETKLVSDDFIYDNIFNMSDDVVAEQRKKLVNDVKRTYRYLQIEQGQSDPAKFGFPQDSPQTSFGMEGGEEEEAGGAPPAEQGFGESQKGPGRPKKGLSYGQDNHPRGRDPLGADELYKTHADEKRTRTDKKKFPLSYKEIMGSFNQESHTQTAKVINERHSADQLWDGHKDAVKKAKKSIKEHSSEYGSATPTDSDDTSGTYLDEKVLEK